MKEWMLLILFTFLIYTPLHSQEQIDGYWFRYPFPKKFPSTGAIDIAQDHLGYIWIMTSSDLYFLDGDGFQRAKQYENGSVDYKRFIGGGKVPLAVETSASSFNLYPSLKADKQVSSHGSVRWPDHPIFNQPISAIQDDSESFWALTQDFKLYRYIRGRPIEVPTAPDLSRFEINIKLSKDSKLLSDEDRGLWILAENGLLFYNNEKNIFQINKVDKESSRVTQVYEDYKTGKTYLLTSSLGVIILDSLNQVVGQHRQDSYGHDMNAFTWRQHGHMAYVYALTGLFSLNTKTDELKLLLDPKFVNGRKIPGQLFNNLNINPDSTYLLIGTKSNNFYTYDLKTAEIEEYKFDRGGEVVPNVTYEISFYSSGQAMMLTDLGIYLFDKKNGTIKTEDRIWENLIRNKVYQATDIAIVSDTLLYISSLESGFYLYHLPTDSLYRPRVRFEGSVGITDFEVDDKNDAWGSCSRGITHYSLSNNTIQIFDTHDGLPTLNFFYQHMRHDRGVMYFGQYGKYIRFRPDDIVTKEKSDLFIQHMSVNGESFQKGAPILGDGTTTLKYDQNNLSFSINGPNYGSSRNTKFEARLTGWQDDWSYPLDQRELKYTGLRPGKYKLHYKPIGQAIDPDKFFSIHIKAALWERPWFIISLGILGLGLGLIFYLNRINYVRKEATLTADYEKKLAQLEMQSLRSQMNPHFIFNSLNSIKSFIANNEPRVATRYLTKFSHLIRLILNNSKTASVDLRSELKALELYIELEKLRFSDNFTYSIDEDNLSDIDHVYIPSMIIQPYVENAIWHGLLHKEGLRHLQITIRIKEAFLEVIVADNGVGRKQAAALKSKSVTKHKSFGMEITADRMRLAGKGDLYGTAVIEDLFDGSSPIGTRVTINIPISYKPHTYE